MLPPVPPVGELEGLLLGVPDVPGMVVPLPSKPDTVPVTPVTVLVTVPVTPPTTPVSGSGAGDGAVLAGGLVVGAAVGSGSWDVMVTRTPSTHFRPSGMSDVSAGGGHAEPTPRVGVPMA